MQCYCYSNQLYKNQDKETIVVNGEELASTRKIQEQKSGNEELIETILESSSIYLPIQIPKISYHQIISHPFWFHKEFISKNRPCIILDALEDIPQIQNWTNPKTLIQQFNQLNVNNFSVSLTPDGFADSIKNKYFVEPEEIATDIKNLIGWGSGESGISPQSIPYLQHQNSNLTQQLGPLYSKLKHQSRDCFSKQFFNEQLPDAQNFWMGYKNSVSSIHKDPYENFYGVLVGEKHFTLMPPISILHLHEDNYTNSKWKLEEKSFKIQVNEGQQTRWISSNPDLKADWDKFSSLKKLQQYYFHIVIEAGQMLYLPSLWYHQVSQHHQQSLYTIAINYWFDMQFSHNYCLYQTARKIKNYN